jgi:hypothetical protein
MPTVAACPDCSGIGTIDAMKCPTCDGGCEPTAPPRTIAFELTGVFTITTLTAIGDKRADLRPILREAIGQLRDALNLTGLEYAIKINNGVLGKLAVWEG